jgi:hypothetical protein
MTPSHAHRGLCVCFVLPAELHRLQAIRITLEPENKFGGVDDFAPLSSNRLSYRKRIDRCLKYR